MGAEEGFLPVEFISGSLHARERRSVRELRKKSEAKYGSDHGERVLTSLRYAPESGAMPSRIFMS
jgi:hypothetical protein